jgi:dienelactone hydrolase
MRIAFVLAIAACSAPATVPPSPVAPTPPSVRVGTTSYVIEDASRRDPVDSSRPRTWIVQLYYPSEPAAPAGVYADDPAIVDELVKEQYYGATEAELRSWSTKPAFAIAHARPSARQPLPLVTLSPGLGFARFNYAELASHLVARGYVVAVIDHPYIGLSRVGDRLVRTDDDPVLLSENPADLLSRVRDWTHDISVTIDDLAATKRVDGLAIDLARITAVGHSIGGTAAAGACVDPRVHACIDFEGFLEGIDALARGCARPTLAVFSRAKGRPPTLRPGEPDPMDKIAAALAAAGQPIWTVKVTGGSHTSFSDAPDVLPKTLSRFGGELMTPERSFELYTGIVDAFARAYGPDGGGDSAFKAFLDAAPETAGRRS